MPRQSCRLAMQKCIYVFEDSPDTLIYTDSTGNYSMAIPEDKLDKQATISVYERDYFEKKKVVNPNKGSGKADFKMKLDPNAKYIMGRWAMRD